MPFGHFVMWAPANFFSISKTRFFFSVSAGYGRVGGTDRRRMCGLRHNTALQDVWGGCVSCLVSERFIQIFPSHRRMLLMPLIENKFNGGDLLGLRALQTCFWGWSVSLERAWYHSNWRSSCVARGISSPEFGRHRLSKCKGQISSGSGGRPEGQNGYARQVGATIHYTTGFACKLRRYWLLRSKQLCRRGSGACEAFQAQARSCSSYDTWRSIQSAISPLWRFKTFFDCQQSRAQCEVRYMSAWNSATAEFHEKDSALERVHRFPSALSPSVKAVNTRLLQLPGLDPPLNFSNHKENNMGIARYQIASEFPTHPYIDKAPSW